MYATTNAPNSAAVGINRGTVNVGPQPRTLTDEKVKSLAAALSANPGTITISTINPGGDTSNYAARWSTVFIKARWSAGAPGTTMKGMDIGSDELPVPIPQGLHIYFDTNSRLAEFVRQTIRDAGIDCHPVEHKDNLGSTLELVVGND